jgi:hypothetical protein
MMATLSELTSARSAALDDYAAKLAAFKTAYVELAALDRAVLVHTDSVPSFNGVPDIISLRHPIVNPNEPGDWANAITARLVQVTA